MKRLWDKNDNVDAEILRFTIGEDPQNDLRLIRFDCLGSAAHVRALQKLGLLSADEAARLVEELARICRLAAEGRFPIPVELEDCHTAIEAHLTAVLGALGEKIHAGRSRNDQVATAMRLFMRHNALVWSAEAAETIAAFLRRIRRDGTTPMPGYSHLRPAMPSSVGLWLYAFGEAFYEELRSILHLLEYLDCCPSGTAVGYGSPLPLDRGYIAELLGFSRVERSPLKVQNSRGLAEARFARTAADMASICQKFACDLLLFSTVEFGFFSLPKELTTGSSIMPQKHNPDVLELLRARAVRLRAAQHELEWLADKLPSGYHRDFQLLKGPVIAAADEVSAVLPPVRRIVESFLIHWERLSAAMQPELFAAQAATGLAVQGVPFREAYRRVAESLREGGGESVSCSPSEAASGILPPESLEALEADLSSLKNMLAAIDRRIRVAEAALLPV